MVVVEGGGGMQVRMQKVVVEWGKTQLKSFSFVRNGRTTESLGCSVSVGRPVPRRFRARDEQLGCVVEDGIKFEQLCGWKRVQRVGKARSIHGNTNPWIKSNKTSSHQQIKKNWGYFWWGFWDLGKKQQNQARKQRVGDPKT